MAEGHRTTSEFDTRTAPTAADQVPLLASGQMWRATVAALWAALSSAWGRSLALAADAAAGRTLLGLGSAATSDAGDFASAAQGALADSAMQPGDTATEDIIGVGGVQPSPTGDYDDVPMHYQVNLSPASASGTVTLAHRVRMDYLSPVTGDHEVTHWVHTRALADAGVINRAIGVEARFDAPAVGASIARYEGLVVTAGGDGEIGAGSTLDRITGVMMPDFSTGFDWIGSCWGYWFRDPRARSGSAGPTFGPAGLAAAAGDLDVAAANYELAPANSPGWVTGRWYGVDDDDISLAAMASALSPSVIYFVPLFVPHRTTIDRIMCNVTSVSGAMRAGLYHAAGGVPSGLVLDAGELTPGGAGNVVWTVDQGVDAGMHWLALTCSGAPTVLGRPVPARGGAGWLSPDDPTTAIAQTYALQTYGPLPGAVTPAVVTTASASMIPHMMVRCGGVT